MPVEETDAVGGAVCVVVPEDVCVRVAEPVGVEDGV